MQLNAVGFPPAGQRTIFLDLIDELSLARAPERSVRRIEAPHIRVLETKRRNKGKPVLAYVVKWREPVRDDFGLPVPENPDGPKRMRPRQEAHRTREAARTRVDSALLRGARRGPSTLPREGPRGARFPLRHGASARQIAKERQMIDYDLDTAHSILLVRPQSRLEKQDFVELAKAVDPQIEASGDLAGLVIDVTSFPGWTDFGSMVSHFRFVRDHQKHVKKVAVVTDSAIGDIAEHLAAHFISAEIKHFPAGQVEEAKQWISGGS